MSESREVNPNVMVKCPRCRSEVPIGPMHQDADDPYRCESCLQQMSDSLKMNQATIKNYEDKKYERELSHDNAENPAPKTRRPASGSGKTESKPTGGTMDDKSIH